MTAQAERPAGRQGGLGKAATSGFLWLLVQSVAARGIGFVSQLALAWLLTPADFGVIGLAYTVFGIANALVSFGVDDVLLQRQKAIMLWTAPAFWICLSLGMLGMVGMLAAAPFAARWYHSPELVGLIAALAVATPIKTLATVPSVRIRADMNFRFLAAYNTFEIFALQLGTILLAWLGCGAYSFAIPIPALAVIKAALFWWKAPPRIGRMFRKVQLQYILGSSTTVFATRTIIEIVNQGDYIVLGLIASHSVVGLYFFAFRFSAQPVRMLAGNFINVLLPAFAQLRGDPPRQTEAALKACRLLAYMVVPFCFMQAALAGPGLHILFGERWIKAVPYVQILSMGLPFDAVSWITGSLLSARREFRAGLIFALISAPIFFGMAIAGGLLGSAFGVAVAVAIYYFTYPPLCSLLILRRCGVAVGRVLELYIMPFLVSALAIGGGYLISVMPVIRTYDLARIIVIGGVGTGLYPVILYVLRRDVFDQLCDRFGGIIGKFRRVRLAAPQAVASGG
ncbi:lipopolysaccharide biosynthesis protein [Gluconacetobacter tumulisoli]|uniref:Lipopolysaccharide biosynthesis protein n=1 Tax=Gluconacetobacter tumulisoli TaxID=1286189 RepID=A0A7W4PK24_9PROT|nr:lipopolysaccharide biosynthesis protein [Gluconacetobacter tumulisoli]MBB2200962.1 lipopolysaccharide biosynthesis protein [Gluconacetobacter tumulisoli]